MPCLATLLLRRGRHGNDFNFVAPWFEFQSKEPKKWTNRISRTIELLFFILLLLLHSQHLPQAKPPTDFSTTSSTAVSIIVQQPPTTWIDLFCNLGCKRHQKTAIIYTSEVGLVVKQMQKKKDFFFVWADAAVSFHRGKRYSTEERKTDWKKSTCAEEPSCGAAYGLKRVGRLKRCGKIESRLCTDFKTLGNLWPSKMSAREWWWWRRAALTLNLALLCVGKRGSTTDLCGARPADACRRGAGKFVHCLGFLCQQHAAEEA